jgi:hypothetical protein
MRWLSSLLGGSSLIIQARRFPRGASVVVVVLLLCLGVCLSLLSLSAGGSRDPFVLGRADVPPVDQWTSANALPLNGTYYPFDLVEEADEDPVNVGLLTTLFLTAYFFGAGVGRPRANPQGQVASCFYSAVGVVGEVLGSAREDDYLAFLSVFRL